MEDHDDWKLGDEAEPVACPRCGKPNRPGLSHCTICGSPLVEELSGDSETFRTLGEAMGGSRRPRREPRRRSLRAWTIAVAVLLAIVVALTWLQTREEPFRLEDWLAPAPTPAAVAATALLPTAVPTDPTIYRFYEALQVYGGALKEVIHEQFGDGIMSAINFSVDLQKKAHPSGDRVVVTFDGKFLPYQWTSAQD